MKSLIFFIAVSCGVAFGCKKPQIATTGGPFVAIDIYGAKPGEKVSISYMKNGEQHLARLNTGDPSSINLDANVFFRSTDLLSLSVQDTIYHSKLNIYLNGALEKSHNLYLKINGPVKGGTDLFSIDSSSIDGIKLNIDSAETYKDWSPEMAAAGTSIRNSIAAGKPLFKYQIK